MDRPVGRKRRRKTETPSSDTRVPITIPDPSDHDRPIWVITIAEMRMAAFFAWLKEELTLHALLPSNPFTKAAHYALERKAGLEVFLTDPDVPLDTNHLDRALRPIPMGRKNWLFCWTELGAERVGQIQSLISTCVLHGVDPYTYLVDVLQRIDTHPFAQVEQLTPRLWKPHFADAPLRSLLETATA